MARRGDELPEKLRTPEGRREFFRRPRQQRREREDSGLSGEQEVEAEQTPPGPGAGEVPLEFDAAKIVARVQGREGWLRKGKRQLEQRRWRHPEAIPRSRHERVLLAAERLEADPDVERRANEAYEHYRATARDRLGRRPGGKENTSDPGLALNPIGFGFVQG